MKKVIFLGAAIVSVLQLTGCSTMSAKDWKERGAVVESPIKLGRAVDNQVNQNFTNSQSQPDLSLARNGMLRGRTAVAENKPVVNMCWYGKTEDCAEGALKYEDGETINFKGNDMVIFPSYQAKTQFGDSIRRPAVSLTGYEVINLWLHEFNSVRMIAVQSPEYPDYAVVYMGMNNLTVPGIEFVNKKVQEIHPSDYIWGIKKVYADTAAAKNAMDFDHVGRFVFVVKKGQSFLAGFNVLEYLGGTSFKVVKKLEVTKETNGKFKFKNKEDEAIFEQLTTDTANSTYAFSVLGKGSSNINDCWNVLDKMMGKPNKNITYEQIIKTVIDRPSSKK